MSRYERSERRRTHRKRILVLFLFIVPLFAVAASYLIMSIYDGDGGMDAQAASEQTIDRTAYKNSVEIDGRSFYRLVLENPSSLTEAEEYLEAIRAKKLNGFILKEDGYKIIYGTFTDKDHGILLQNIIIKKVEGEITESRLPGYILKYDDKDNAFIQLVQATDKLIWEVAAAKSKLSTMLADQPKGDNSLLVKEIEANESKLDRYLGYAKKVTVSKQQEALRDKFTVMLETVLENRLTDSKSFYRIQGSLMNQIEAYRRYSEGLPVK